MGPAVPVTALSIWGDDITGTNITGLQYGDRWASRLDVYVYGFETPGSKNVLLKNANGTSSGCEHSVIRIRSVNGGTSCVTFDGNSGTGTSFDYSDIVLSVVGGGSPGNQKQNLNLVEVVNDAQISGARLAIHGNASALGSYVTTLLQVGSNLSDYSTITKCSLEVYGEGDGSGTLRDLTLSGGNGGISECIGVFATTAMSSGLIGMGSGINGDLAGHLDSPFFTANGVLLRLGNLQTFTLYEPGAGSGETALSAGSATVADTSITANSRIRLFRQTFGGTPGHLYVTLTAATGYTINSSSSTDTGVVAYEVARY
jgi:hypothetical protein